MLPRKYTNSKKAPNPATMTIILDTSQYNIEQVNMPNAKINIPKIVRMKLGLRIYFPPYVNYLRY